MFMCSTHCTVGQIRGFCPMGILSNIFSNISKIFLVQKNILSLKSDLDPRGEKDGSESNKLPVNEDKSKTPY